MTKKYCNNITQQLLCLWLLCTLILHNMTYFEHKYFKPLDIMHSLMGNFAHPSWNIIFSSILFSMCIVREEGCMI